MIRPRPGLGNDLFRLSTWTMEALGSVLPEAWRNARNGLRKLERARDKRVAGARKQENIVAGLIPATALAPEKTSGMAVFMGTFETGTSPVTTFSNTDTITIRSSLPEFSNLDMVGSLHFGTAKK